ncbi:MAG: hypothetical protein K0Q75_1632 [Anaerospora sp.]|nr:hypothetical protein [Anaerospora sp.]
MHCQAIFNVAYYGAFFGTELLLEVPETGDKDNVSPQTSQNSAKIRRAALSRPEHR